MPDARVMPAASETSVERAAAGIPVQHVLAAGQPGRAAGNRNTLVSAKPRLRHGRRLQIEVDVVGSEQIEQAVAVGVEECAAGAPACFRDQPGTVGDVLECPVAAIAEQAVLAPERDVEIVEAVIVVVAGARALPPPGNRQAGARRHIFECPVAAIAIQVARGLLAARKPFQRRAVDEKQIEPAVVVVVERGHAAAGRLEQEFVGGLTAVDGGRGEPRLPRHVREREANRRLRLRRCDRGDAGEDAKDVRPHHGSRNLRCGARRRASSRCVRAASGRPARVNAFASS